MRNRAKLTGVVAVFLAVFSGTWYYTQDVTAAATIGLLLVTAWYAYTVKETLSEMQRMRQADLRPYVSAYFTMEKSPFIYFDVENSGRTGAVGVQFTFDPSIRILGKDTTETAILNKGIPFLPPGRHLSTFIASSFEYHDAYPQDEERVLTWKCQVAYTDAQTGQRYQENFLLDLEHLLARWSLREREDLRDLVKEVKGLREEVKRARNALELRTTRAKEQEVVPSQIHLQALIGQVRAWVIGRIITRG